MHIKCRHLSGGLVCVDRVQSYLGYDDQPPLSLPGSMHDKSVHSVQLLVTPWTSANQAPLSMLFPRQEYWSGLPLPSPGDPPDQGIKPPSRMSPALAGLLFMISTTWEAQTYLAEGKLNHYSQKLTPSGDFKKHSIYH